jgi:hypothetical protein
MKIFRFKYLDDSVICFSKIKIGDEAFLSSSLALEKRSTQVSDNTVPICRRRGRGQRSLKLVATPPIPLLTLMFDKDCKTRHLMLLIMAFSPFLFLSKFTNQDVEVSIGYDLKDETVSTKGERIFAGTRSKKRLASTWSSS